MGILSDLNPFVSIIDTILDRVFPDKSKITVAELELKKAQLAAELQGALAEYDLAKGQLAINKAEAESDSLWKGGWRPAIGWACASAFIWACIAQPILTWLVIVVFHQTLPPLPAFDMTTMVYILCNMLGFGAFRTYEKVKGVK